MNKEVSIMERAKNLARLSRLKGSKTAAVGLRAIQEINALTGLSNDRPNEAAPMFLLTSDAKVSISVTKVVK